MKCEVCLTEYPKNFKYKNKIYNLLPIELPKKYLILVSNSNNSNINNLSNNNNSNSSNLNAPKNSTIITLING